MLRDNFTCQACGQEAPSVPLEVAQIIPFHTDDMWNMKNCITLCPNCHKGRDQLIKQEGLEDDIFVKRFNITL